MQGDSLLLVGLCGFALAFIGLGALAYFYGWRFLTFGLIGGAVGRLLGGKHDNETAEDTAQAVVTPPHLDAKTAVEDLPDFHAAVAQYRRQEKFAGSDQPPTPTEAVRSDAEFTADPGPNTKKGHYGVRYSSDNPGRVIRDRRYERVRGPDSGDDPEVYHGMFEKK
jgi:hypothetical protein